MLSRAISENMADLTDARAVLLKNRELRHGLCTRLAQRLKEWTWTVVREKSIYHTLNSLRADVSGMLRGEGWVVASEYGRARAVITKSHADMDLGGASLLTEVPKPWPTPPTHFKMNKFTVAYQEFVNTCVVLPLPLPLLLPFLPADAPAAHSAAHQPLGTASPATRRPTLPSSRP